MIRAASGSTSRRIRADSDSPLAAAAARTIAFSLRLTFAAIIGSVFMAPVMVLVNYHSADNLHGSCAAVNPSLNCRQRDMENPRQVRLMRWQERLNDAVKGGGWNASEFQAKLSTFKVKGSSYGSVWAYLNKPDAPAPPMEFFEVAAHVLGVRPAWLAFGDEPRTEEEQRVERDVERVVGSVEDASDDVALQPQGPIVTDSTRVDLVAAWKELMRLRGGALGEVAPGANLTRGSEGWQDLQRAVREPLTILAVDELPGSDPLDAYVAAVALALRQYTRAVRAGR
jgi:hypothetical protein